MSTSLGRSGFTVVELLVAIAVIGLLMAIALPAVQFARESSRRTMCQNHLREIGLALSNFETSRQRFPPGRDAHQERQHSWCTAVLPFLDQKGLFDRYDYSLAWDDPANAAVVDTTLSVFTCPSTPTVRLGETHYGGNYGSTLSGLEPGYSPDAAWSAGAMVTVRIPDVQPRKRGVAISEITDGTSQTLQVVEAARLPESEGGKWANGHSCVSHDNGPVNEDDGSTHEVYSFHPGGAHVLFCDGHVRFLSESVDLELLGALATRANQEVRSL